MPVISDEQAKRKRTRLPAIIASIVAGLLLAPAAGLGALMMIRTEFGYQNLSGPGVIALGGTRRGATTVQEGLHPFPKFAPKVHGWTLRNGDYALYLIWGRLD